LLDKSSEGPQTGAAAAGGLAEKFKKLYSQKSKKVTFSYFEFEVVRQCYNLQWNKLENEIRYVNADAYPVVYECTIPLASARA
jgi:hypothetical protein